MVIGLFSSKTEYGEKTIGQIEDTYYQLGDQIISVVTALMLFEKINNIVLSNDEVSKIMLENGLGLLNL
jgi:hypothetical protein